MTSYQDTAEPHLAYLMRRTALPMPAQFAISFAVLVTKWSVRRRSRQHLAQLSAHQLKDIGITAHDAYVESTLPFWRS